MHKNLLEQNSQAGGSYERQEVRAWERGGDNTSWFVQQGGDKEGWPLARRVALTIQ